jgi:hypothetical protein
MDLAIGLCVSCRISAEIIIVNTGCKHHCKMSADQRSQCILFSVVFTPSPSQAKPTQVLPVISINYLCTYDLYSPVHNVLDAYISHYEGKWECHLGTKKLKKKHYAQGCINHRCIGGFMHMSPRGRFRAYTEGGRGAGA